MHQRNHADTRIVDDRPGVDFGEFYRLAEDRGYGASTERDDHARAGEFQFRDKVALDTGRVLKRAGRAVRAGGRRWPAFYRIAEIEKLFGLDFTRGDRASERLANHQVARIRKRTPVFQGYAARRLTENHQSEARSAAATERKPSPGRNRGTFVTSIHAPPERQHSCISRVERRLRFLERITGRL